MRRHLAREMVADWHGAGRAITGKDGGTRDWYAANGGKMKLHADTRMIVDRLLTP